MILEHYDNTYITCDEQQYFNLEIIFKILSEDGLNYISSDDIRNAFYQNDDIYYSGKFLFESDNCENSLIMRYCNLAKLIYLYHYKINDDLYLQQVLYDIYNCQ